MEIPKISKLFGIVSLVCILMISMVSLTAAQPDVCRDLPDTAEPGDTITVNLDITLEGANKTVIEENVPDGWIVSNPTDGGFVRDDNTASWINPSAAPGDNQISYDVTIPENATSGSYDFNGEFDLAIAEPGLQPINCDSQLEITQSTVDDTDESTSTDDSSDSENNEESSTGGSVGGTTGEQVENVVHKDVKSEYVTKGETISYDFNDTENSINYVKFNALKNSGDISTTIEILDDTSALVDTAPPGNVYQNLNIWVGKSGFAVPENIENPVIGFRVEKTWIENNNIDESNIMLLRFDNGEWSQLNTQKVDEEENFIYFESEAPGFSPFAITAMNTEEESNVSDTDEPTSSSDNEQAMGTNESPTESNGDTDSGSTDTMNESDSTGETNNPGMPGFGALIAIGIILVVYYIKRK